MEKLIRAISQTVDAADFMRRASEQVCAFFPNASGAAISIRTRQDELLIVSAHGSVSALLGRSRPAVGSFQQHVLVTGRPTAVHDIASDERVPADTRSLALGIGVRSWAVIPLPTVAGPLGTLSVVADDVGAFSPVDIDGLASIARFLAAVIASHSEMSVLLANLGKQGDRAAEDNQTARFLATLLTPDAAALGAVNEQIDALLAAGIEPVFQPIVSLASGTIVEYEALARFPQFPQRPVSEWFDAARQVGRGAELEAAAIRAAIEAANEGLDPRTPMSLNASPSTVLDPAVRELFLASSRPLILELTEHEKFPATIDTTLQVYRDSGVQIAVDDAGAGYSSFSQILRLRPDFIKIDGDLIAGIETDPARRVLTQAVAMLARELHAVVIAEAVETVAQRDVLLDMAIDQAQGYLFGRPARLLP